MQKNEFLKKINENFYAKVPTMDKKEIRFISGKNSLQGILLGFLERKYYQRERLIKQGEITYGLTFKAWSNDESLAKPYPTWVLFSPESVFKDNPNLYQDYLEKIYASISETKEKRLKALKNMLDDELGEPQYFEVPPLLVDNHIMYISSIFIRPEQNPKLGLGVNLIIMNPLISKEIIYLPDKYCIL
jgi:hypothetical protein